MVSHGPRDHTCDGEIRRKMKVCEMTWRGVWGKGRREGVVCVCVCVCVFVGACRSWSRDCLGLPVDSSARRAGRASAVFIDWLLQHFSHCFDPGVVKQSFHRLSTYGRRAFAIAGPTTWNSLPTHLRRVENSTAVFGRLLKTYLFSEY